ncbi:hypothetical protein O181_079646 [Austropuccinia psidii MF-1]|uniref:Tc1-like transposase DDE domain-containing protein n=1 Tax=Austropuccinia psidii MF-1 TaxID=1389203 RepID=A0A9Q3FM95_9BASI|nr:hypothetical protein [Austropuccinia psidii MF-1]
MDEMVEVGVAKNCKGLSLMGDGALIHIAIASQKWHDRNQIHKLNLPPSLPDLNPNKNLWFNMENIVTRLFNPKKMYKLSAAIYSVWDDVPFDHLELLFKSLPRKMQMVIDQNGASTCW